MTRWLLAIAFIILVVSYYMPVAALDVGKRIGPVVMDPGGIICDTAADAITAIRRLSGESLDPPASCGQITQPSIALIEVQGHYENAGNTYTIIKIVSSAFSSLQYGWMLDTENTQETPIINESVLQGQGI